MLGWQLYEPPRSDAALAAALPLAGFRHGGCMWTSAVRISAAPGGLEEFFTTGAKDTVRNRATAYTFRLTHPHCALLSRRAATGQRRPAATRSSTVGRKSGRGSLWYARRSFWQRDE